MKTLFCAAIFALFSIHGRAENPKKLRSPNQELKIEVATYSKDYPLEQLKGNQYQLHNNKDQPPSEILNLEAREQILNYTGLYTYISDWDQLERDILLLRAQNNNFETLVNKYPALPKNGLLKLYEVMKKQK